MVCTAVSEYMIRCSAGFLSMYFRSQPSASSHSSAWGNSSFSMNSLILLRISDLLTEALRREADCGLKGHPMVIRFDQVGIDQ